MEEAAFASGRATPQGLMEAAGAAVVTAMLEQWPDYAHRPPRTRVLCGPGNNGGDGYVIARLLHQRGWPVEVLALAAPRTPPAQEMRRQWDALGPTGNLSDVGPCDLIVDALFGIGAHRPFDAPDGHGARCVAVDIPSGLDADTGTGAGLRADLTVTFHAAKPGHYLAEGPDRCGILKVVELGLEVSATLHLGQPKIAALRKAGGHKFDHGHALVFSGEHLQGGAARMAARAAMRVGAGLVTLIAPTAGAEVHANRLDAIMLRTADSAADLSALLEDTRINALCIGPGFGVDRAADALPVLLEARRNTVLDADALTAIGPRLEGLHDRCILTPHPGEFRRLFPDLAEASDRPKPDRVREAAARAGCTVLLKGHDTVIANPAGRAVLVHASYDRAAPWLATAGAGDVLAGLIAGLLARDLSPFEAAETAAWLHIEAARAFGPGLMAEDLPEQLPAVFRSLGL